MYDIKNDYLHPTLWLDHSVLSILLSVFQELQPDLSDFAFNGESSEVLDMRTSLDRQEACMSTIQSILHLLCMHQGVRLHHIMWNLFSYKQ